VADEVNFATSFFEGCPYCFVDAPLDKKVGTIGVDANAGEVGSITNSRQPSVKLGEIKVRSEEAGDDYDG
jgi:hypothetical protein